MKSLLLLINKWLNCKKYLLFIPLTLSLTGCGTSLMGLIVPGTVTQAQVEEAAVYNYSVVLSQSQVVPANNRQARRIQDIAKRLIALAPEYNPRSADWQWEVNLLRSEELNAWCMAGGKIAFYTAIIEELQLTDDEIAMVMGHEIVHALEDHIYYQINKEAFISSGISYGLQTINGIPFSGQIAGLGATMLNLSFSRSDEKSADLVGQELAARAGYNPQAAVTLWEKFQIYTGSGDSKIAFLSTHPANASRIDYLRDNLPNVMPLYEEAIRNQNNARSNTRNNRSGDNTRNNTRRHNNSRPRR